LFRRCAYASQSLTATRDCSRIDALLLLQVGRHSFAGRFLTLGAVQSS
jgi:hypothetical protein